MDPPDPLKAMVARMDEQRRRVDELAAENARKLALERQQLIADNKAEYDRQVPAS